MILDENLEFADATVLPTATGISLFGDVIDLSVARDIGAGHLPLALVIQITTAVVGTTSTVEFRLASDAAAAIATDGTATEHGRTDAFPEATLIAGYKIVLIIPPEGGNVYERFLGVLSNVGTNVLTAGNANAFLTKNVAAWKAYADATN